MLKEMGEATRWNLFCFSVAQRKGSLFKKNSTHEHRMWRTVYRPKCKSFSARQTLLLAATMPNWGWVLATEKVTDKKVLNRLWFYWWRETATEKNQRNWFQWPPNQARGNLQNILSVPGSPPYWSFTFWDFSVPEGLEADEPPSDVQSEGVHSDLTLRPDAYVILLAWSHHIRLLSTRKKAEYSTIR